MKRKTAALYNPYLDILGGGEKHILSILKVLEDQGYEVSVFWDKNLTHEIKDKLNIHFNDLHFTKNIFIQSSPLEKMQKLREFDLFLYVTDGSYFVSTAKTTIIFCMVPDKKLYHMDLINRIKTWGNYFISNSRFTQTNLQRWGIRSDVIYPFIDNDLINTDITQLNKKPVILSVGRFFTHLHNKRHDIIIEAFEKLQKDHPHFHLILAGGMKQEDKPYVNQLIRLTENNNHIQILTNISRSKMLSLYREASVYWHMAGYHIDENTHPEKVEHLGISPLEAMAAGTPPLAYLAGGMKEIIKTGENGILVTSVDTLVQETNQLMGNVKLYTLLQTNGQKFVKENFSYAKFKEKVIKTIL